MNQMDLVKIKTTKNVKFLSSNPGHMPNPDGVWSVVGFIGSDALITKDTTVVRIPVSDLRLVGKYKLPFSQ